MVSVKRKQDPLLSQCCVNNRKFIRRARFTPQHPTGAQQMETISKNDSTVIMSLSTCHGLRTLLRASKNVRPINPFNPHASFLRQMPSPSFFRQEKEGPEKLGNLPKGTQLRGSQLGFKPMQLGYSYPLHTRLFKYRGCGRAFGKVSCPTRRSACTTHQVIQLKQPQASSHFSQRQFPGLFMWGCHCALTWPPPN